ncbi:tetratricopeptide repeat protein [Paenibacillus sp. YIM B09110]|uniref:tetratricopeptide repeat protein n=1 Tax=Paenibacillus sp. YIM B09110 TaxID=3126102 RepID=UPI00301D76EF
MDDFGQVVSLEEELRQAKPDIFIGRERIVSEFMQEAESGTIPVDTRRVHQYYGVGGIGKSTLREHLIKRLEQLPGSVIGLINFENQSERTPEAALQLLRMSMGKRYKIKFTSFDLAYETYMTGRSPQAAANGSAPPLIEEGDLAANIVNTTISALDGIGLVPKAISSVHKFYHLLTKRNNKKKMAYLNPLKEKGDLELYKHLPRLFSEDLRKFAAGHSGNVYIFIDTYEALWTNHRDKAEELDVDDWIRDWAYYTPGVTWVILGREKLRWIESRSGWKNVISFHEMPSMNDEECRATLAASAITDDDIVSQIIAGAEGLPFSLRLSIDQYNSIASSRTPVRDDFKLENSKGELIKRFMKHLNKEERRALELLALTRSWDRTLFGKLITHFNSGRIGLDMQEIVRFSFMKENSDKRWEMHALMRLSLRESMHAEKFDDGNQFLFGYYAGLLEAHDFRSANGQPDFWLGEAFFHGFSLLEKGAMELKAFVEWFRKEDARFYNQGNWGVSISLHKQLVDYLELSPRPEREREYKQHLAVIVYDLAFILFMFIRYDEAEKQFRYAKQLAEASYAEGHAFIGKTFYGLATILQNKGEYAEAEALYLESLRIRENALGENHLAVALSANNLGTLYHGRGRLEEAKELYLRSIRIRQLPAQYDSNKLADGYLNLARLYHDQRNYSEAEHVGGEALGLKIKLFGMNHMGLCNALNHLGNIFIQQGQYARANTFFSKAIRIARSHKSEDASVMGKIYYNLAVLSHLQEELEQATEYIGQCLEIQKLYYGEDHYRYRRSLEGLAGLSELAAGSEHSEEQLQLEF